jgi:hypothetical protein
MRRYELKSTMMTSNRPLEDWGKLIGDVPAAGANSSQFKGGKNPVENGSWNDCQDFLTKLKDKASGMDVRLPTEAEWEYACRAGSSAEFCYGLNYNFLFLPAARSAAAHGVVKVMPRLAAENGANLVRLKRIFWVRVPSQPLLLQQVIPPQEACPFKNWTSVNP